MSLLAQLQIDLVDEAKHLASLLSPAGNPDKKEILNTWKRVKRISKEGIAASNGPFIPSFTAIPITGEHTQGMTDLTDKRWERNI